MKFKTHSLTRISIMCNFNSLEYFSRIFKKMTSFNPNKFYNKMNLTEDEIAKINDIIIKLYQIKNIKNNYLKNRKIISNNNVLTIFKKK